MQLTQLPTDILGVLARLLDTHTLARAACTCTTLRDAAAQVPSLRPQMNPANADALATWLELDHIKERVTGLRATRTCPAPHTLHALPNMRMFAIAFTRVPHRILRALPTSLLSLHIHRLVPSAGSAMWHTKIFPTDFFLKKFVQLRRAHITFGPGWNSVVIEGDLPATMQTLELRCAPIIVVRGPIPAQTSVSLHAFDWLRIRGGVTSSVIHPLCKVVTLACDNNAIEVGDFFKSTMSTLSTNIQSLDVSCPNYVRFPLDRIGRTLRSLRVRAGLWHLPDLRSHCPELRTLEAHVDHAFVCDLASSVPNADTMDILCTTSQGSPTNLRDYCFSPKSAK